MPLGLFRTPLSKPVAYALALAMVALATLGTFLIYPWIEPSISLLFFLAIVVPAMYGGYGPALFSTVLSALSLAYFFVPPRYSFDLGIDDLVRLAVFVAIAVTTAWLSAARRSAEEAQRRSLADLRGAVDTLRKLSGWPVLIGADVAANIARMLAHAANVVDARRALVGWESDDEPWLYVADSAQPGAVTRHANEELQTIIAGRCGGAALVSAAFDSEHVSGRVFFADVGESSTDLAAAVELVAREVGGSLDQLYLAERLRQIAVREDRLKVSRDLHDGVLQSLTGIRLQLQAIAEEGAVRPPIHDRLIALERALAIEQRELRLFIDQLRPKAAVPVTSAPIAPRFEEMCARLSAEWNMPIALHVSPPDLALAPTASQPVRLMVHEAIVNALKHAHASHIDVSIEGVDRELRIVVEDDGCGFPFRGRVSHEQLAQDQIGPASLRGRVAALDGQLAVESTDHGSRVELTVPLTFAA